MCGSVSCGTAETRQVLEKRTRARDRMKTNTMYAPMIACTRVVWSHRWFSAWSGRCACLVTSAWAGMYRVHLHKSGKIRLKQHEQLRPCARRVD